MEKSGLLKCSLRQMESAFYHMRMSQICLMILV